MASSSSSSASSSSAIFVKREEFNAFHMIDRALFTRLVISLRRDISQSFQVMSFLLFLEKSGLVSNLIANLVSFPDFFINAVAEEVGMCLSCLSHQDFATFLANLGQNINSFPIPLITRMTGEYLTLTVVHQNRETILLEMKKHLTCICYPAFEDIRMHAEMYNKEKMYTDQEREKTMEKTNRLGISKAHKAESSSKFLSDQQETIKVAKIGDGVVAAFSEGEQVMEDNRTVFLTFSKGYPISEAEVHAYFTRRFGEIIEAIRMPGVEGNDQALYARLVLNSAAKIPEIVSDGISRTKYTINGKHVWARKYIPKSSINNLSPSYGVSL